jgi:hypothetical protein
VSHGTKSLGLVGISTSQGQGEQPCTFAGHSVECPFPVWECYLAIEITRPSTVRSAPSSSTVIGLSSQFRRCLADFKPRLFDSKPRYLNSTHRARHPTRRKLPYVLAETETEKTIRIRCRVWSWQAEKEWTVLRVHINGSIFVEHPELGWVQSYQTDMTFRQERQMRYIAWGSTKDVNTYRRLADVPRMETGYKFWLKGEPENDGLYATTNYMHSGGGVRLRRILPDYCSYKLERVYRTSNTPWTRENHHCDQCYPNET